MEREPNKEIRYPKDKCANCNKKYEMTPDNTRLNIYSFQEFCNHYYTTCTKCEKQSTILFTGEDPQEVAEYGYPIRLEKYPPDNIYEAYLRVKKIELIKEKELTMREMSHVAFLGYILDSEELSPEDFSGTGELFI